MSSTSIRIRNEVHDAIQEIAAHVARHGWASIQAECKDPASIGSVVAVAVEQIYARLKVKKDPNV